MRKPPAISHVRALNFLSLSFDQYVVLLKNTVTQMVYKHAISTVVPARPITIQQEADSEG